MGEQKPWLYCKLESLQWAGCTIFPFCRSAPPLRFVFPAGAASAPAPLSTSGAGPARPWRPWRLPIDFEAFPKRLLWTSSHFQACCLFLWLLLATVGAHMVFSMSCWKVFFHVGLNIICWGMTSKKIYMHQSHLPIPWSLHSKDWNQK